MPQTFSTPLSIIKCKLADEVVVSVSDLTPYTPKLYIYSLAGSLLYGPVSRDKEENDTLYWTVAASAITGVLGRDG